MQSLRGKESLGQKLHQVKEIKAGFSTVHLLLVAGREHEVEGDRGYLGLEGLYTLMSMSWDSSQGMHLCKLNPGRVGFYPSEIS